MRFVSMILCCAMAVLPLCTKGEEKKEGAHIKFETTTCDFGAVSRQDNNKKLTFRFVNDGTEPLVILAATTSCQCLKSEFSRKPIAVGEMGEIKVYVDVNKMEKGIFHRVVQIRSNSVNGIEILTVEGSAKD